MNPRNRYTKNATPAKAPKTKRFITRAALLRYVVFIIGLILLSRLFYLQVVRHGYYQNLANLEHQKKYDIPASRGMLYFRDGDDVVPAVLNAKVYTLYADPTFIKDTEELANFVSASLNLKQEDVKQKLEAKNTSYSVITKRLSKKQIDQLFSDKQKVKGLNYIAVPQRVYPEGSLAAQTLGFVNDEGKGQYGIEESLNERLSGQTGELRAITDVTGVPLTADDASNIAKVPKNGDDLVLTVDRNIQAKAEEALEAGLKRVGATKGSVVVVDPQTGAIRAMANRPTYSPADYFKVGNNAYESFSNRIISDPYEAGSVMKTFTMTSGIDAGVVSKNSTFANTGEVKVDDATITNVLQDVNGTRTMTDVLQYSLNTGVVHVLSQLGGGNINTKARERLYDYFANKYGFGQNTGVEQAGEVPGTIFGPKVEQGNNVRYANMAFGQGMNVTMIQVASAFSALVNGGNYYKPHIVEGVKGDDGSLQNSAPKPTRANIVSKSSSDQIRSMTNIALSETPVIAQKVKKGYMVGGKTGTSQTIDPRTGKYRNDKTIGSYLGYGGDSIPRYVIMVRVDDATRLADPVYAGSMAAAPIFADVSNWLIDYYNIRPL